MIANPIHIALSAMAERVDQPITSVSVIAPAISGQGILVVSWSGLHADTTHGLAAPEGVGIRVMSALPDEVALLPAMVSLEAGAIACAWVWGAWDVSRIQLGPQPDGALPPSMATIESEARAQGYITWSWRPMLRGPETRAKAHRGKDLSLNAWTLGRDAPPPDAWRTVAKTNHQNVIQLGRGAARPRRQSPPDEPATPRQVAYIRRLLGGDGAAEIPETLGKREASIWIDRLTGAEPPAPSAKPAKQTHLATLNQWRVIDHLRHRQGMAAMPLAEMRTMTYRNAERIIAEMRGQT